MKRAQQDVGPVLEAARQLSQAAAAKKCWPCGCLHNSLAAIERAFSSAPPAAELEAAICAARKPREPVEYDCLGCEVCYPALAVNGSDEVLLVWTEGTGWQRGGSFAWQLLDEQGRVTSTRGRSPGIPVWSFAAAYARPNGSFVILY